MFLPLVHFTQNDCADTARDMLSTNFCAKEDKHAIARALDGAFAGLFFTILNLAGSVATLIGFYETH